MNLIRFRRLGLYALSFAGVLLASPASRAADVGQPAPPFTLTARGGDDVSLSRFDGHVVYLDFWASWCGPCRESFPWMNEMLAKYGSRGLNIVAINVDSDSADAKRFLAKTPAQFTVLFDPDGKTPEKYQLTGMPNSFLVDGRGKVIMVHQGFTDADRAELEKKIATALGLSVAEAR